MAEPFHFEGFAAPTTTQVPDEFFDELAPRLTEAELRVALYIIRRTFGFKKTADDISLKQLVQGIRTREGKVIDHGAGVAKSAAARAVRGLVEKGVITTIRNRSAQKGDEPTTYALRFRDAGADPVFSWRTRGSPPREHARVPEEDTQQTVRQQTVWQPSKSRKPPTPDRVPEDAPTPNGVSTVESTVPIVPNTMPLRARLPPGERRRYDADRRRIVDYLSDFARELGDAAPLASSVSRAVNLMRRAGVDLAAFTEALYHARAVTKERWAGVRKESKTPGDPFPRKEAMAYFFAELEHALGLRELPETPAEHAARKEAETQERRRGRERHPDWARATGPRDWVQTYKPGEGLPALEANGGTADGA